MCQAHLKHSEEVHVFGGMALKESMVRDVWKSNNMKPDFARLVGNYQIFSFNSERADIEIEKVHGWDTWVNSFF